MILHYTQTYNLEEIERLGMMHIDFNSKRPLRVFDTKYTREELIRRFWQMGTKKGTMLCFLEMTSKCLYSRGEMKKPRLT